jgi:uncharacterized OB-fold protein
MTTSISNKDDQPTLYWERVREIGFALPRCADCGRFHFYPRPACPWCASTSVAPASASGRGTVYSYSVVHRAPSKAFADQVPYVVAIIETDEGPHLMSRIVGIAPEAVTIGLRVKAGFGLGSDPALAVFQPETEDA